MKNKLFTLAAAFTLAAVIGTIYAAPALAGVVKAVLFQSVDEPGRNPYQEFQLFDEGNANCTAFSCTVKFAQVPAGRRLVLTYASANYAANGFPTVSVTADSNFGTSGVFLPTPQFIGANSYVAAGPISLYVEAGQFPRVVLSGTGLNTVSTSAPISLVGYFVSVP